RNNHYGFFQVSNLILQSTTKIVYLISRIKSIGGFRRWKARFGTNAMDSNPSYARLSVQVPDWAALEKTWSSASSEKRQAECHPSSRRDHGWEEHYALHDH
ncbi:MAG: hypothetical protein Q4C76_07800, partial [Bacillota bacterium]|nr:hypothetical protein [Bacillota bacterium]